MAGLSLEEMGLRYVLEQIACGEFVPLMPSVRYGLAKRGLIEGEPPVLTLKGELALDELRLRPMRRTGEFPSALLAATKPKRARKPG